MKERFKESALKDDIDLETDSPESKALPADLAKVIRKHEQRHRSTMIMFEDDSGAHPNLWAVGMLASLISLMIFNLITFHKFQMHQEEMAGYIESIQQARLGNISIKPK